MVKMVTRIQTSNRFRSRKLSTKINLVIHRESNLDTSTHYDAATSDQQDVLSNLPKVETGVESKEERVSAPLISHSLCHVTLFVLQWQ